MIFTIEHRDPSSAARCGILTTAHGNVHTPVFMPVGTTGAVKAVAHDTLVSQIGTRIILGNTYHLYLRPGMEVLQGAGGIHRFSGWDGPVLTDSGGYQVYSLSPIRKISEEGVKFRSHIDGSEHFFSPEIAIDLQRQIGADIIMAFDECTPWPCSEEYAESSMALTHRWLHRCIAQMQRTEPHYGYPQILAPIVQGSTYRRLRMTSAEYVASCDLPINAIGGLSVGEPAEEMYAMTEVACSVLPAGKPRYLMGVGTPADILESIALGVDMFDCVLPTRNARHGLLYTWGGIINIRNEQWKNDHSPVDPEGTAWSRRYSRAYLRHLIMSREILGYMIASVHNLVFYHQLMTKAAEEIREGRFAAWKDAIIPILMSRPMIADT